MHRALKSAVILKIFVHALKSPIIARIFPHRALKSAVISRMFVLWALKKSYDFQEFCASCT